MPFPSEMEINRMQETLHALRLQNWLGQDLWSWQWWLLLAALIIPWLIWFRLADRRRIFELLSYGFMAALVTGLVDSAATGMAWVSYPYKLIPAVPCLIPVTFGFVPVSYMLLYQYSHNWKTFLVNSTLFYGAAAFLLEPLARYLGLYELLRWNYLYSFLVYMVIAVVLRAINLGFHSLCAEVRDAGSAESKRLVASPALKRQPD
ncbi:MAG: CBO0543 family protein [Syntrophomonadaceae bacterium]